MPHISARWSLLPRYPLHYSVLVAENPKLQSFAEQPQTPCGSRIRANANGLFVIDRRSTASRPMVYHG